MFLEWFFSGVPVSPFGAGKIKPVDQLTAGSVGKVVQCNHMVMGSNPFQAYNTRHIYLEHLIYYLFIYLFILFTPIKSSYSKLYYTNYKVKEK